MHYEKGTMTQVDYDTYTSLFEAMVMTPYFPHPDLLIYLEGSLDDILSRIQERGRPMEQQTPVSYWEEMHERYEKWINNFHACPVLRLNINEYDVVKDQNSMEPIIEKVSHHMKQSQLLKNKPPSMGGLFIVNRASLHYDNKKSVTILHNVTNILQFMRYR